MAQVVGTTSNNTPAVIGTNSGAFGSASSGVSGVSTNSDGVTGTTSTSAASGVAGFTSIGNGVYGGTSSSFKAGVWGNNTNSGNGIGVSGTCGATGTAVDALGGNYGVYAQGAYAAVYASGGTYGILASGGTAGQFNGNVNVTGNLSKGGGGFLIDHPISPTANDLIHSFVESPERKNVYDGVGSADATGQLTVQLPAYVEALNEDFRYQLTPIGGAAPDLHVKTELTAGRFVIGGAKPGQRVCWQLTGNRKDAWAIANPLVVEPAKAADETGRYRHPAAHGHPEMEPIGYVKPPPRPELVKVPG
jgi:hypothetical protein